MANKLILVKLPSRDEWITTWSQDFTAAVEQAQIMCEQPSSIHRTGDVFEIMEVTIERHSKVTLAKTGRTEVVRP